MKVAALFSGGKDSTYALYVAQQRGWTVGYLVSVFPLKDSFMFHVPNIHFTPLLSKALGIPLVAGEGGKEELKVLSDLLKPLDVDGVVTGAIASDFQFTRINRVCYDLGLRLFSPLWRREEEAVLADEVDAGFEIRIVGVSAEGMNSSFLGRKLDGAMISQLLSLREEYGINLSGEGGEYETLVVDGPNFRSRMKILEAKTQWDGKRGTLEILEAALESKRHIFL